MNKPIQPHEISSIISRQIKEYNKEMRLMTVGTVFQVGDGIARIYGLQKGATRNIVNPIQRYGNYQLRKFLPVRLAA